MKFRTIAIVGLGLMGASLAAACRKKFRSAKIIGISRNPSALRKASRKGWVHEGTSDFGRGVRAADLVCLCTPVDTFPQFLSALDRSAKPGTLVTDVGSVKGVIERWFRGRSWKNIKFVSAHPMVGSHLRGIEAAAPDLYDKGFAFLIREPRIAGQDFKAAKKFWRRVMPRVIEINARRHDRIVSEISHLPHVAAVCLVLAAGKSSLPLTASGFKDSTRIAQGDPSVWAPIFRMNRREILRAVRIFEKNLRAFKKTLRSAKDASLRQTLAVAARKRAK